MNLNWYNPNETNKHISVYYRNHYVWRLKYTDKLEREEERERKCGKRKGHFIPSGAPMDGKVSDCNDDLVLSIRNNFSSQLLARTD